MKHAFLVLADAFDLQMVASSLIALVALVLGAKALTTNPTHGARAVPAIQVTVDAEATK